MIEWEIALQARSLLSNVIISLVEDEHLDIVTVPPRGGEGAHAGRLHALGSDIATLASAIGVILRRSVEEPAP